MAPINEVWHCNCLAGIQKIKSESIPLILTSPPWDNIFEYGGHAFDWFDFCALAKEMLRVLVPGGVLCYDIADKIVPGGNVTGTKYRHVVQLLDTGLSLREEIAFLNNGTTTPITNRHGFPLHSCFVFVKGERARCFHKRFKKNKNAGTTAGYYNGRNRDGTIRHRTKVKVKEYGYRNCIWLYVNNQPQDFTRDHPARMSPGIVRDLILTWSNPGDLVLDVFAGSGTTLEQALLNHRFYLGFEIHAPYVEMIQRRMRLAKKKFFE